MAWELRGVREWHTEPLSTGISEFEMLFKWWDVLKVLVAHVRGEITGEDLVDGMCLSFYTNEWMWSWNSETAQLKAFWMASGTAQGWAGTQTFKTLASWSWWVRDTIGTWMVGLEDIPFRILWRDPGNSNPNPEDNSRPTGNFPVSLPFSGYLKKLIHDECFFFQILRQNSSIHGSIDPWMNVFFAF